MTINEAQKNLEKCENDIQNRFTTLRAQAQTYENNVADSAVSRLKSPALIVAAIMVFVALAIIANRHPVWGIVILFAGLYLAYTMYSNKKGFIMGVKDSLRSHLDSLPKKI